MKHFKHITVETPAMANGLFSNHPGVRDSIKGLLMNPVEVISLHLDLLKDPSQPED